MGRSVHINPDSWKICLVCRKAVIPHEQDGAHAMLESSDGLYYGGHSWHKECFDLDKALMKEHDVKRATTR